MVILQLQEQPPLIRSIFSGQVDEIRTLLTLQQDVNYQDIEKRTPLHAAAFKGDATIASILLFHGARVDAKDNKWYTPLHRACYVGSEETVNLLLRHQAAINSRDRLWQTPLHVAAANDAYGCVAQLLNFVQNPNVTDRAGRTALHHAAFNGHTQVAELLISKGCIVNACDKKDGRPLHCASYKGHVEMMDLLLRSGADINVTDRNQYAPLHVAAASGMDSACKLLLDYDANPDAKNAYGNTPLHIACLNGHLSVCQVLIEYGADIEAVNYRGQTPLHIAAASTHGVECLLFLLEHKVDINRQSADGRTPLHMTAIHGRFTRSKTLIDRGAIVDCTDKNGCTALHIAAQYGHELLANTLLSFGADASKKGFEGRTPLHMCCLSGYVECCRKFLQAGVDLDVQDDSGKTATHCAAYKGSVECLDLLVSNGAKFQITDQYGRIPLHYAASQGHYQCVFTLVTIGSKVNLPDSEGCTPLHLSASYDLDGKCVDYLIAHKADPTAKDKNGYTPIHYAVAGGNYIALGFILNAVGKQFLMYGPHMPLTTPIHLAARNGNMEVLCLLLQYFPDTNIKTEKGSTPLLLAAREGHAHCVQMLLRYGAKVGLTENVLGMSPIHVSAKNGHMHCLALLLDNAEDKSIVDRPDKLQRTALMLAVSGKHSECVLTLLKSGADPNVLDGDGHSSLFRAVMSGQHNVVQLLISEGAKVNFKDVHGKTVLHLAAVCGHLACLQAVHNYMNEEEAITLDNQQCTALHWACYAGSAKCVEYFLEHDIFKTLDGNPYSPVHCACFFGNERCVELLCKKYGGQIVHLEDSRKRTPLHIASIQGHVECAKLLLEQEALTETQDDEGRTPLIVAAQFGQSATVDLLLYFKAKIEASDKNGNTALHMACVKKHSHAALMLLESINNHAIVNLTNTEGKTALHLAARNGLVEVTKKLLEKGASIAVTDNEGFTPALACAPNTYVAQCLAIILKNYSCTSPDASNVPPLDFSLPPLKAPLKLRSFKAQKSQTDISLLQNPDIFECERLCNSEEKNVSILFLPVRSKREIKTVQRLDEDFDTQLDLKRKKSDMSISQAYDDEGNSTVDPKRSHDQFLVLHSNKTCHECLRLQKKCASCLLKRLMKQHVTGKLKITELRTLLKEVCTNADADYKKSLIKSLESFKACLNEKKAANQEILSLSVNRSSENIANPTKTNLEIKNRVQSDPKQVLKKTVRQMSKSLSFSSGAVSRVPPGVVSVRNVPEGMIDRFQKRTKVARPKKDLEVPKDLAVVKSACEDAMLRIMQVQTIQKKIDEEVAEIVQEIYCKESKRNVNEKPSPSESSLKVLENGHDGDVFKVEEAVKESQMKDEELEKMAAESLKNIQRQTINEKLYGHLRQDSLKQLDIIQDGIAELKNTEYLGDIAQYVQQLKESKSADGGSENISSEACKNENDDGDTVVKESLNSDGAESMPETNDVQNTTNFITESVCLNATKDNFEKPIVDGNICLVPFDLVKQDTLWENIERSSETFLRNKVQEQSNEGDDVGDEEDDDKSEVEEESEVVDKDILVVSKGPNFRKKSGKNKDVACVVS